MTETRPDLRNSRGSSICSQEVVEKHDAKHNEENSTSLTSQKLEHPWALWTPVKNGDNYSNVKRFTFKTLEEVFMLLNSETFRSPTGFFCQPFFLMRDTPGHEPDWDLEPLAFGGRISCITVCSIPCMIKIFTQLLLSLVGGSIPHYSKVHGIEFSIRKKPTANNPDAVRTTLRLWLPYTSLEVVEEIGMHTAGIIDRVFEYKPDTWPRPQISYEPFVAYYKDDEKTVDEYYSKPGRESWVRPDGPVTVMDRVDIAYKGRNVRRNRE
ncbi:hypothetical protein J8273_5888 [Carpediemonas membranifera]|uniref:Uncharacterized protein n=1 Tax=Carpediemonas membranifera TaxID=201153 RepID=A0A8J6B2B6_9EUKA|nr:hypothetical protein J8273_5888 [Carpediemonas membranifera]|eukprot:KAG9392749.1 hypothetical protein J8273_5888 [Carpediemonas membranifera]